MANAPSHSDILAPGSIFERKYRIVREIGRGGFGMVYLAHQEKMGRDVALKVLRTGASAMHQSAKERFLREVKIISRLRHPNTVTIHDFGETQEGLVYMVLEFIEGKTVKAILREEGAQEPRRALALAAQIARSLAEAHRHGVIHRDLKPANIMVGDLETESDFVKVLDFGIARLAHADQRDLTSVGLPAGERELIGTPRYMSPEQVRGESLTPASDVYGVGLILYEMLVGQPAVTGDTTLALISQQISPEPLPLPGLRTMPAALSELIRRATAKRLPQRFPDAETFGEAIEQTLMSMGGALPGSASARQTGRFAAAPGAYISGGYPAAAPASVTHMTGPYGAPHTPRPELQSGAFDLHSGQPASSGRATPFAQPAPARDPLQEQATNPVQGAFSPQPNPSPSAGAPQRHPFGPGQPPPASPFTNSVFEYAQGKAGLDPDLPPPPSDTNMFSAPDPAAASSDDSKVRPQQGQTTSLEFAFQFFRMALFGLIALIGLYLSFILVGPIFGHFVSGTLKLAATAILASAIPLLTALGENSKRERFDVIDNPYDRITRVFIGTAIFSFGTGVLCSLAMSGGVVHDLRRFPNWFLSDAQKVSKVGRLNEQVSLGIAQVVEDVTSALGIYSGVDYSGEDAPKPARPAAPPAPTRPATRVQNAAVADDDGDNEDAPSDLPKSRSNLPPATRPTNPNLAPSQPKTSPKPGSKVRDSDYVDW